MMGPLCSWCLDTPGAVRGPDDLWICADCLAVCCAALDKRVIDPDTLEDQVLQWMRAYRAEKARHWRARNREHSRTYMREYMRTYYRTHKRKGRAP